MRSTPSALLSVSWPTSVVPVGAVCAIISLIAQVHRLNVCQQIGDLTIREEAERQHLRHGDTIQDLMQRLLRSIAGDPAKR